MTAAADDNRPRHIRIKDILLARIEAGTYPIGSYLPTEKSLCGEFAASRHTVREALRGLTEAGLIQRRQGAGSQIIAIRPQQRYVHAMRSLEELFQYAADTEFRISSRLEAKPSPEDAPLLTGTDDGAWLVVEGMRHDRNGRGPICFSRVYINREFAAISDDLPGLHGAIHRYIEERFAVEVAEAEQEFCVVPTPPEAAAALGRRPEDVSVRVLRRYLDKDGGIILVSINMHPADQFTYAMRMRRQGQ